MSSLPQPAPDLSTMGKGWANSSSRLCWLNDRLDGYRQVHGTAELKGFLKAVYTEWFLVYPWNLDSRFEPPDGDKHMVPWLPSLDAKPRPHQKQVLGATAEDARPWLCEEPDPQDAAGVQRKAKMIREKEIVCISLTTLFIPFRRVVERH